MNKNRIIRIFDCYTFTLLELLIVIAIIMLLVSMLLPAISKTKEKAKQLNCGSNMKQIGVAFQQYCDDYQGLMPVTDTSAVYLNWTYYFAPYFGLTVEVSPVPKYYQCPSKTPTGYTKISTAGSNSYLGSHNSVYRPNQENGFNNGAVNGWFRIRKLYSLQKPSVYVTFAEAEISSPTSFYFQWANDSVNRLIGINSHAGQANYLHADGHASKMIIPEALRGSSQYKWNFYPKGVFETGPIQ